MTRKPAWYSIKTNVHHVCSNCTAGNNIEPEDRREGTGQKPLCVECVILINKGNC